MSLKATKTAKMLQKRSCCRIGDPTRQTFDIIVRRVSCVGEVRPRQVVGGLGPLRPQIRHPSGHNHPGGDHTHADLHRGVRLLLQVRLAHFLFGFFFFSGSAPSVLLMVRLIGWRRQEEESAGGARVREGEAPAGEPGGERSRSLQEGVHRYRSQLRACVEEREKEKFLFLSCLRQI